MTKQEQYRQKLVERIKGYRKLIEEAKSVNGFSKCIHFEGRRFALEQVLMDFDEWN